MSDPERVVKVEEFLDDTCLRCDAWDIRMETLANGRVEYTCQDCNYFWTNEV